MKSIKLAVSCLTPNSFGWIPSLLVRPLFDQNESKLLKNKKIKTKQNKKMNPVAVQKFWTQQCRLKRRLKCSVPSPRDGMGPDRIQVFPRLFNVVVRHSKFDCNLINCLAMTSLAPACTITVWAERWRSRMEGMFWIITTTLKTEKQ